MAPEPSQQADVLERVREIVSRLVSDHAVRVYLFGSYAHGKPHHLSDIDVAIKADGPLPVGLLARLREALEESTVPVRVDIADMNDVDEELRNRIGREGIEWNVSRND